jgi:hypothetical protein
MARPKVGDTVEVISGCFKSRKGRISFIPKTLFCDNVLYFIKIMSNIRENDVVDVPFIRTDFKVCKNVK